MYKEEEYKEGFSFFVFAKIFKFIRPYKKNAVIISIIMIFVAAIDVVFPLLSKYAVDNFAVPKEMDGIWGFALVYLLVVVIQSFNIQLFIFLTGKLEFDMCFDIRKKLFDKLMNLSFSYYDRTPAGWIMARTTSDAERISEIIAWGIIDIVWSLCMMTFIIIAMIIMNFKLALLTLSIVPPLILISMYFQKKILSASRAVRKQNSIITGAFNEGILGAKTTKTLVREKANLDEFKELTGKMKRNSVRAATLSALFTPAAFLLGSLGTSLALLKGGTMVINESISYGMLTAFIAYSIQFFDPIRNLAGKFAEMQNAQASAERVFSLLEAKVDIEDNNEAAEKYLKTNKKGRSDLIKGDIEFRDVCFKYKEGEHVLNHFNLKVKGGQTIALVGETGSGKSTIVNLLCRFYEPVKGKILIDKTDYKNMPLLCLYNNIGYVLQEPHLFNGTLMDNIRYGRLDASNEEVISTARLVHAHEFIIKLKDKYNTIAGEGGSMLSAGERQLISFARALLKDPPVFVLDEATSSVDTHTEHLIQEAVNKIIRGRTSFIIAHRLSTIRSADRILVIEKGKIIEDGTHDELFKNKGYYYNLYTSQFAV